LFASGALAAGLAVSLAPRLAAWRDTGPPADATRITVAFTPNAANDGPQMPGQPVYDDTCSRCHGPQGQEGKAPSLVPFRWTFTQALDIVRHGGSCGMPAFTESDLSDDQLKQIIDYLKTLK
jgi:mono/diheme cytochrome c family protein